MDVQAKALNGILVDPHSPIPAYAQLKDQIKIACAYQEIKLGDVLPSIRALARQMNVGDGVVRRAYRELCDAGLLVAERRKHIVATPALVAASETDLVKTNTEQCDRLIAWAVQNRLSAIALGRLLLRRALARETVSPSYLFVDICRLAAEASVARISKAWGIKIAGVSVGDFANHWNDKARHLSAVLVSQFVHQDVIELAGDTLPRVFPVRMRMDERLQRRISRLPKRSKVLLVYSDSDQAFPQTGRAVLQHCEQVFTGKWRLHAKGISEISDLASLIRARRYRLHLFGPLVWGSLPDPIKRMNGVALAACEPEPRSLEEVRVAAGVLL